MNPFIIAKSAKNALSRVEINFNQLIGRELVPLETTILNDVDATSRIGDLNEAPLHTILPPDNPTYMRLIEEQQRGEFRAVYKSCDYYKSIDHMRMSRQKDGSKFQSIDEFKDRLRVADSIASDNQTEELATTARAEPGPEKIDAGPATIVP